MLDHPAGALKPAVVKVIKLNDQARHAIRQRPNKSPTKVLSRRSQRLPDPGPNENGGGWRATSVKYHSVAPAQLALRPKH